MPSLLVAAPADELVRQAPARRGQRRREIELEQSQSQAARRRRSIADEAQQNAALANLVPTGSTEIISGDERQMAVGSRAERRDTALSDGRAAVVRDRLAFREALGDARQAAAGASPRPCGETTPAAQPAVEPAGPGAVNASSKSPHPAPAAPASCDAATPVPSSLQSTADTSALPPEVRAPSAADTPTADASPARPAAPHNLLISRLQDAPAATAIAPHTVAPSTEAATAKPGARSVESPATASADRSQPSANRFRLRAPTAEAGVESAEKRENLEKILRVIRHHMTRDGGSATLRLDPPHLGSLRIDMDLKHEALALRLEPADHAAHRLLSQSLDDLKRELQAAGFHVTQMELRMPMAAVHSTTPNQPEQYDESEHGQEGDESDERPQGGGDRGGSSRGGAEGDSGIAALGLNVVA